MRLMQIHQNSINNIPKSTFEKILTPPKPHFTPIKIPPIQPKNYQEEILARYNTGFNTNSLNTSAITNVFNNQRFCMLQMDNSRELYPSSNATVDIQRNVTTHPFFCEYLVKNGINLISLF